MKTTTVKRTTISLTKQVNRHLEDLKENLGENSSQVISRALTMLHASLMSSKHDQGREILNASPYKL